jgi:Domain of unknown function (DUF4760)
MTRAGRLTTYFLVAVGAAYIIYWLIGHQKLGYLAPFLGSILITIGWMVTSRITVKSAQRQHTVSMISGYNKDQKSQDCRLMIIRYWPDASQQITQRRGTDNAQDLKDRPIPSFGGDEDHELFRAMSYELDAFEFMSVAVFNQTMDEQMLKESLKTRFTVSRKLMRSYIEAKQRQYAPKGETPTIWTKFMKLCDDWEREQFALIEWVDP